MRVIIEESAPGEIRRASPDTLRKGLRDGLREALEAILQDRGEAGRVEALQKADEGFPVDARVEALDELADMMTEAYESRMHRVVGDVASVAARGRR